MADQKDDFLAIEQRRVKGNPEGLIQFVTEKNYRFQFAFFLNAYPEFPDDQKELIFSKIYPVFQKYDKDAWAASGKNVRDYLEVGSVSLEWAHKIFETVDKPVTQLEFKALFATIDVTHDGKLSLIEYLMYKYSKSIVDIASRPQIANPFIAKAQAEVDAAQAAIDTFKAKMADLEAKSKTLTGVQQRKVLNEIEQNKNEDVLNKKYNADLAHAEKALRTAIGKKTPGASGVEWLAARFEAAKIVPQSKKN